MGRERASRGERVSGLDRGFSEPASYKEDGRKEGSKERRKEERKEARSMLTVAHSDAC
jgi:hypothetical protein